MNAVQRRKDIDSASKASVKTPGAFFICDYTEPK